MERIKDITEKTGTYTIQKNPNYINENKIGSGPHCCIIVKIKQNTGISDYSALIEDDGMLKLQQVFSYLDDYKEPEYTRIFKKQ